MYVHEVMLEDTPACAASDSLEAVAIMMWQRDCGSVPVLDPCGKPIGVITVRDIAMAAALNHKPLWELSAAHLLGGRPLFTCRAADDIKSTLRTMWAKHMRQLPVVDEGGCLLGMISMDDIVTRAERGRRGAPPPEVSFDDAMSTIKSVAYQH